jgi:predicted lipoprotein
MTAAAQSPPRDDGASRRRVSPRVIGLVLAALVIIAMALDTTYKKGDVKTTASGRKAFDPASYGKDTFPKAVETLDKDAVALPALLAALRKDQDAASEKYGKREGTSPYAFAASGTGVAGAAEGGLMQVKVPGVPKATRVSLQVGPALNGTSIRDAVGFIKFGQFTNQVEYADAGTALNNQVKARVLKGVDPKSLQGKRVKFVGAFTLITPDVVTITPVRLEPAS